MKRGERFYRIRRLFLLWEATPFPELLLIIKGIELIIALSLLSTNLIRLEAHYAQASELPSVTLEQKFEEVFGSDWEVMYRVAKSESNLNENAYNPEWHKNCQGSYGILQVSCLHVENPEDLFDLDFNLKIAKHILDTQGLQAWSVCKNGKVDCGIL